MQIQSWYNYVFTYSASILCLREKRDKQFMGISFFCKGQANTYTRHSTNAVSILDQRRRRWPIIEKLTAPTIFIVFVGYIATGSGYPGGVGDEILLH